MDARTRKLLTTRFDYAFVSSRAESNLYPALLHDRVIEGPFSIGGLPVQAFEQQHGPDVSLGYRIGGGQIVQQPVARPHRRLIAGAVRGMAGVKRQRQPVQE